MPRSPLLSLLASLLLAGAVAAALATAPAQAGRAACGSGTAGARGYAYAGLQAASVAHGVRARITAAVDPVVDAGHVAGWVGVGGPGQGRHHESTWVQAGVASIAGQGLEAYAEILRPAGTPTYVSLRGDVAVGETVDVAVLEIAGRPGVWRVWLDGRPVTKPIVIPGSTGWWRPIVTAESFNDKGTCNTLGFRFEQVRLASAVGGGWRAFTPGHRFLDRGLALRPLSVPVDAQRGLAATGFAPYAFEAGSSALLT